MTTADEVKKIIAEVMKCQSALKMYNSEDVIVQILALIELRDMNSGINLILEKLHE